MNSLQMHSAGIDIGSSTLKVCLFDLEAEPRMIDSWSSPCPLLRPQPNRVEHNLGKIVHTLQSLLAKLPPNCDLGFASAMHGLVMIDNDGQAIGDCISWADGRSSYQAARLKKEDPDAHRRTGTPIHPMAWPSKILWAKEVHSATWNRVARLTDLKNYVLEQLTGMRLPLDISIASSTGLWNQLKREWDRPLLERLKLDPELLPPVSTEPIVETWDGHRLFVGAGDGPLANLGVGAVTSARVALSLGTSGAIRQFESVSAEPIPTGLFRYALNREHWVRGGAVSNGTSVLDWLRIQKDMPVEEVLQRVSVVEPGADGMRVYPYFSGERAPFWQPEVKSHITGWSFEHSFRHLARATVEGVAFCLKRLLDQLEPTDQPLRCTGGFFTSPVWRQLLADVTGHVVAHRPMGEASALGAALLTRPDYLEISAQLPAGDLTEPAHHQSLVYSEIYDEWLSGDPTGKLTRETG